MGTAGDHWRDQLHAWAIPEHILAAADESPWVLPKEVFVRRADRYLDHPAGVSYTRAMGALDPPGSVLDVGAGAGAASLPLARRTTELTAVDPNTDLLDALTTRAATLGLKTQAIVGRWPDVADQAPTVDVVVCHHVFYNVPELADFALALTSHARCRVVVELTARHPLVVLNPLWTRFHGLDRPSGPTADDAVAVLVEAGIAPRRQRWQRPQVQEHRSFDDLVETTRRRLCLPPGRSAEVADALRQRGVDPHRPADLGASGEDLVTLWWNADG